jgi:hypothetical protein
MASFAPPVRFCCMPCLAATLPPDFPLAPPPREDSLDWIDRAERDGASRTDALAKFDRLPPVSLEAMHGYWQGAGLHTGHPIDGMLAAFGWWGKAFHDSERVDPLLFRHGAGIVAIDPRYLPLVLADKLQVQRRSWAIAAFRAGKRLLSTTEPAARLRHVTYRGVATAAMVYDRQPIIDLFRAVTPDLMLGLMDWRGYPPFFFTLRRATPPSRV